MNTQTDGGDAREIHIFRRCSKQLRVDGEADTQRKQVANPARSFFVCLFHTFERVLKMRFVCAFLMLCSVACGQTVMDLSSSLPTTVKTIAKAMGVVRPSSSNTNIYGKLVLEAGSVLEMPQYGSLTVQFSGAIDCRGTEAEPVIIRAQNGVAWSGIKSWYRQTGKYRPQITMTYTNLTGLVGGNVNGGIEADYTVLFLDNVSISMPSTRPDGLGKTTGIALGNGMYNATTGITYNCVGIVSNCKLNGMTTGILDTGRTVDFIDIEATDVLTPFLWQYYATPQHFYHRFSVER